MSRSPLEIKARCSSILDDDEIVSLVEESSSPSAAYEMVFEKTKDASRAKAGRWLAVLRRDHPEQYQETIANYTSHASKGTAQPRKDEK